MVINTIDLIIEECTSMIEVIDCFEEWSTEDLPMFREAFSAIKRMGLSLK